MSSRHKVIVVWYADYDVLWTLAYCEMEHLWMVGGYLSVHAATGVTIPDADLYYRGVGYVEPPVLCYGLFVEETNEELWEQAYWELHRCSVKCH